MDFVSIIVFVIVYFIRPQDWVPGLEGRSIVNPIMAVAILAMLFRPRGFELRDFIKTPADWLMLGYFGYIAISSDDAYGTAKMVLPLFAFYFVTRQALSNQFRLTRFLNVWTGCVVAIAAMAVLSTVGLDLTGAADLTEATKGRLVLNTWLLDNPNALGHTAIVGIPLIYFSCFWKKPMIRKLAAIPLAALIGYCVYLTQSKGAFLAGFATLTAAMVFGRPKLFQIAILGLMLTVGTGVLYSLPRMEVMGNSRKDEGIVGRLMAWELARTASRQYPYGEGYKQFKAVINWHGQEILKATHSSYVNIGADLGYPGLIIYLAILYCGGRVLVSARPGDDEAERARRMLFTILFAYCVSNWLIDRAYHVEYFLVAGAISAFHVLMRQGVAGERARDEERIHDDEGVPAMIPDGIPFQGDLSLAAGSFPALMQERMSQTAPGLYPSRQPSGSLWPDEVPHLEEDDFEEDSRVGPAQISWRRIGIIDGILIIVLFRLTIETWDYVLKNM